MTEKEEVELLIEELKKYDTTSGYKLEYDEVRRRLQDTADKLASIGEGSLEYLHLLLKHEETWSCLFALEILRKIKSEKSIPHLIEFIRNNEHGDYWESCEEAMYALSDIGAPAVEPLLKEVKAEFENREFYTFLVCALTRIKDERVYSFMVEVLRDCIKDPSKYERWFCLDLFVCEFPTQERKEVLPLLKELLTRGDLADCERVEVEDAIRLIENPEELKRQIEGKPVTGTARKKIGRNDPCPCGSGKKYKKCCLGKMFNQGRRGV